MKIVDVKQRLCPALFLVFYKDDDGKDKYSCGFGLGVCYTCPWHWKEQNK